MYFSHPDLVCGYWQMKVAEQDHEKTGFFAPEGLSIRLTDAPAKFQRIIITILDTNAYGMSRVPWKRKDVKSDFNINRF